MKLKNVYYRNKSMQIIICSLILGIVSLFLYLGLARRCSPLIEMLQNMYLLRNGIRGNGDGQFHRIHDIDFNPSETRLYAIDRDGNRIQVFDKNGTFLFKWGSNVLAMDNSTFHIVWM